MKRSNSELLANEKPNKRLSFSLSEQRKQRFSLTIEEEVQSLHKGVVTSNTKSVNEWALKYLLEWSSSRSNIEGEAIPADILSCTSPAVVSKCLCYFVEETRKTDGTWYPPSTIRCLLAAFQRIMESNNLDYRLFEKGDLCFAQVRKTVDSVSISQEGRHLHKVQTCWCTVTWGRAGDLGKWFRQYKQPVEPHQSCVLDCWPPFRHKRWQEHRDMKVEQLTWFPSDGVYIEKSYYEYIEHGSKNYQGTFHDSSSKKSLERMLNLARPDALC